MTRAVSARVAATLGLVLGLNVVSPLACAADVAKGAEVFDVHCGECHSLKPGKNRKGPSLHGVVGRRAGGVPDFVYSEALKASGITWTSEMLARYVASPRSVVLLGKMKYDGKPTAQETSDLVAFLESQH